MDVLQLADVFEAFRDFSMCHYQLDPAHYVSLPSLSWDAMLKYTGVELELPTDSAIYEFFRDALRGGICVAVKRHAIANNTQMGYIHIIIPRTRFKSIIFNCLGLQPGPIRPDEADQQHPVHGRQ